jgi:hypothetical protein
VTMSSTTIPPTRQYTAIGRRESHKDVTVGGDDRP